MTTTLIIVVAGLVVFGLGALLLLRLAQAADAAAEASARADKAERDAKLQEEYAEIATNHRDADGTAGVLDEGQFLLPTPQSLHARGTETSRGGDTRGA